LLREGEARRHVRDRARHAGGGLVVGVLQQHAARHRAARRLAARRDHRRREDPDHGLQRRVHAGVPALARELRDAGRPGRQQHQVRPGRGADRGELARIDAELARVRA